MPKLDRPPVSPILSKEARSRAPSTIGVTALLNAGMGANAKVFGNVSTLVEANMRHVMFASRASHESVEKFEEQLGRHPAVPDWLAPHVQFEYLPTRFKCARASETGLPDHAYDLVIVDRMQTEPDVCAVVKEAKRLVNDKGQVVFIDYGHPHLGDPNVDWVLRELMLQLDSYRQNRRSLLTQAIIQEGLAERPPRTVTDLKPLAHATVDLKQLHDFLRAWVTIGELEHAETFQVFGGAVSMLNKRWQSPTKRLATFELEITVAAAA